MNKLLQLFFIKLESNRIPVAEISKKLDIPADRIYQWKGGRGNPKQEDSEKIQNWLASTRGMGAIPEADIVTTNKNGDIGIIEFKGRNHEPEPKPYIRQRFEAKLQPNLLQVPFYDAEASAGLNEMDMSAKTNPTTTIDVGDLLRDSEAAMRIYGNSMTPNYPSGCIIGIAENVDGFIVPGEVYVIETIKSRYFKRLYLNDAGTVYICYSDNTSKFESGPKAGEYFYPTFPIPFDKVRRLFDVTGVIKRNKNSSIIQK